MTFNRRHVALALLIVAAVTAAVYWPGLSGPFLLDDFANVLSNRPQQLSIDELKESALGNRPSLFRRPVANLSFALNYLLGASGGPPSPGGYKAFNLLIHLFNIGLVYGFLRYLLSGTAAPPTEVRVAAIVGAAAWALHPLHVSTVLYVVQRMALLSTLFTLAAVWIYYQTRTRPPGALGLLGRVAVIAGLLAMGMLSKESTAVAPLLLLSLELTVLAGIAVRSRSAVILRSTFIWLPLIAGAMALVVIWPRIGFFGHRAFTMGERVATELPLLLWYLRQIVIPLPGEMGLYLDAIEAHGFNAGATAAAAGIAGLLVGALAVRRRYPLVALGILWFFAGHAIESSFLPLELAFEHRNYLPAVGPALVLAFAIGRLGRPAAWVGAAYCVVLTGLCFDRIQDWRSEERLVVAEYRNHPESLRASLGMFALAVRNPDSDLAERIIATSRPRYPAAAHVMQLLRACLSGGAVPAGPPALGRRESHLGLLTPVRALVAQTTNGQCVQPMDGPVRRLLAAMLDSPALGWTAVSRLRLLQMQAWIESRIDPIDAAASYERAVILFPSEPDPIFQKAYLWLNANRPDLAREEIQRIRARIGTYSTPVQARLEELEGQLDQLQRERQTTPQPSGGTR